MAASWEPLSNASFRRVASFSISSWVRARFIFSSCLRISISMIVMRALSASTASLFRVSIFSLSVIHSLDFWRRASLVVELFSSCASSFFRLSMDILRASLSMNADAPSASVLLRVFFRLCSFNPRVSFFRLNTRCGDSVPWMDRESSEFFTVSMVVRVSWRYCFRPDDWLGSRADFSLTVWSARPMSSSDLRAVSYWPLTDFSSAIFLPKSSSPKVSRLAILSRLALISLRSLDACLYCFDCSLRNFSSRPVEAGANSSARLLTPLDAAPLLPLAIWREIFA